MTWPLDYPYQERKRTIPEKPPTPKRPPQPKIELDDMKPPPVANLDFDVPDFSLPTDFGGAPPKSVGSEKSGTSKSKLATGGGFMSSSSILG